MSIKKLQKATEWRGVPLSLIAERNKVPTFVFVSSKDKDPNGILMHEKFTWANVVAHIGLFNSVGTARKSGWDIPIEGGYTEAFFSKSDGTPLFVFIVK